VNSKTKLLTSAGLFVFIGIGLLWTQVLPYQFGLQRHIPFANTLGNYDTSSTVGVFHGREVSSPLVSQPLEQNVLGSQDPGVSKHIEVDLTNQKLYAVEDGKQIAEFDVSTGRWGWTPTGTFRVWTKLKSTRMTGGSKALRTYYDLPNVPYTMFFYNEEIPKSRGYGIHGAYWHSNFGEVMSHGCINMRIRDVEKLFYWATPVSSESNMTNATEENPGIEIIIYESE